MVGHMIFTLFLRSLIWCFSKHDWLNNTFMLTNLFSVLYSFIASFIYKKGVHNKYKKVQKKTGLDNTMSTTPDVVTGCHQLSKFDTLVVTFTVFPWWLNNPCSWASKTVCLQIPGWYCIQISVPFFKKYDGFRTFVSRLPLFWLHLIFCQCYSPNPPISAIDFFWCFNISIHFYNTSKKYMLDKIKNVLSKMRQMDYGQLIPMTTHTQDKRYPRQLVPKTNHTHNDLYPRRIILKTTRTQDQFYPQRPILFRLAKLKQVLKNHIWCWPLFHGTHFFLFHQVEDPLNWCTQYISTE